MEPHHCRRGQGSAGVGGGVWTPANPQHPHSCGSSGKEPLWQAGRQAGSLLPESAHKRIKVLLSGRHWVRWLIIHFLKVWIFPPFYEGVCACVSECDCHRTVCFLYVLTDGSSLVFCSFELACLFNVSWCTKNIFAIHYILAPNCKL